MHQTACLQYLLYPNPKNPRGGVFNFLAGSSSSALSDIFVISFIFCNDSFLVQRMVVSICTCNYLTVALVSFSQQAGTARAWSGLGRLRTRGHGAGVGAVDGCHDRSDVVGGYVRHAAVEGVGGDWQEIDPLEDTCLVGEEGDVLYKEL